MQGNDLIDSKVMIIFKKYPWKLFPRELSPRKLTSRKTCSKNTKEHGFSKK
jgi:hypothetical protein